MPFKDKEQSREYHTEYMKSYREENRNKIREINKKSEQRPERKKYLKKYQKESPKFKEVRKRFQQSEKSKQYQREWIKNNKDKIKIKDRKYYYTIKGIVNILKKKDKAKFGFVNKEINIALVNFVNERDKECPYCGKDFKPRAEYDHVNPFKPLSKDNIAKACSGCNQSKLNADLLEWMNFKGYEITKKVKDLYKKAYN